MLQGRTLSRYAPLITLLALVAVGLVLRLWAAWETNQRLPDTPDRLVGDEVSYDWPARELLQGSFFPSVGRPPVYPLFLAACYVAFGYSFATVLYVQAFVGATTVLLTYLLARRFLDRSSSLVASTLVAGHPILIRHGQSLYTEVLYTCLLILMLLALLWGFQTQRPSYFVLTGALLAVMNLTRPAGILLLLILPFIMPRAWSVHRRMLFSVIVVMTMLALIAPWAYHNYRIVGEISFGPTPTLWQGSPEYYHFMERGQGFWEAFYQYIAPYYHNHFFTTRVHAT